jgi:hypothetical protein
MLVINQATPTVTWATPADITFGTPLAPAQLDASASVSGAFRYTPAANTILSTGQDQTLSVTFTPDDAVDYKPVTKTTSINVRQSAQKVTPTIAWPDPAAIAYGTPLGAAQLDSTASYSGTTVTGTFTYRPGSGTVLSAGPGQLMSVTFTPNDTTDYNSAGATAMINVTQATPMITWSDHADITFGTPLGAAQLDATASIPGVFTYTPAAGTLLNPGSNQTLTVTFTPFDTRDYTLATAESHISVDAPHPPPPLVTVTNVQVKTVHLTKRKTVTDILVTLSGAVDTLDADSLVNYHLAAPGKGKKSRTYNKVIRLSSAVYDETTHRVTLLVNGKLALTPPRQLRVTSSGLLDATGRLLDGNHDGQPGGDYVALLSKGGAQPQSVIAAKAVSRSPYRFPVGR